MATMLLFAVAVVLPGGTSTASAQVLPESPDYICHRTNSASNPYIQNSPATAGILAGHFTQHAEARVATSPTVAQQYKDAGLMWGDIIEPFAALPAGLNWTAEGQAIWNNGCKFATTPPSATLTIVKECVGSQDGENFAISVSEGESVIDSTTLDCGQSDTMSLLVGVSYVLSETPQTGWETSIRGLCDGDGTFTMPAGGGTCTVSNTAEEQTATLFIEKECIGTDDGTDFTINVSGGIGPVVLGCGETSDPITVDADTVYTVSETAPDGWTGPNIRGLCDGDGTFSLEADDEGTCVVQNVAEEGTATLIIEKECIHRRWHGLHDQRLGWHRLNHSWLWRVR
jgi:hypothetical protein